MTLYSVSAPQMWHLVALLSSGLFTAANVMELILSSPINCSSPTAVEEQHHLPAGFVTEHLDIFFLNRLTEKKRLLAVLVL